MTGQSASMPTTSAPIWADARCSSTRPTMATPSRVAIRLSSVSPTIRAGATTAAGRARSWAGHQACQGAAGEHLGLGEVTIDHDCRHQRQSHPDREQDDKLEGDDYRGERVHGYAPGEPGYNLRHSAAFGVKR